MAKIICLGRTLMDVEALVTGLLEGQKRIPSLCEAARQEQAREQNSWLHPSLPC